MLEVVKMRTDIYFFSVFGTILEYFISILGIFLYRIIIFIF